MLLIGSIQAGLIDIEGIRILHQKLPHAQQPRFRTRLISELGLDLIPDLRKLLVAPNFAASYDVMFSS